jgi:ABC-type bacteriocin/lantibiotic exporter with double-glycine peptidase domain
LEIKQIKDLWGHLSIERKKQFYHLIFFILLGAISEFISIGLLIPFIAALSNPDIIFSYSQYKFFFNIFSAYNKENFIGIAFIFLAFASVLAGFIRIMLIRKTSQFSYNAGADLNLAIYKKILSQNFDQHLGSNKTLLIDLVINKTKLIVTGLIYPLITILSSIVMIIFILILLLLLSPKITFFSLALITFAYFIVTKYCRINLKNNSELISKKSSSLITFMQESLGSIRDIILSNSHQKFYNKFSEINLPVQKAESDILIVGQSPKYLIESFGMVLLAFIALFLIKASTNRDQIIVTIGVMALSAQRLLPLVQNIYFGITSARGVGMSLNDILSALKKPIKQFPDSKTIKNLKFNKAIVLKNITYRYPNEEKDAFNNINLKINQGDCVGIIGDSGCGKSTLLDLIMGLTTPSFGEIYIDGIKLTKRNLQHWQKNISHVPQNIFLINESIKKNITFLSEGDYVDYDLLDKVCNVAQLKNFVGISLDGIKKEVGDRGDKVSGGQKQRIGLARAMYKKPTVFILDEATSALDPKLERKIIQSIYETYHKCTIIMVTHRKATLINCNKIFKLEGKKIITIRSDKKRYGLNKL